MPFIDAKFNVRLTEEKEIALKTRLGEAISGFPGKNEYWLMIRFDDNCRMWFRGYNNFPIAMVKIELYGSADEETCSAMTASVCQILGEELDISADHVYVEYAFTDRWGWNGENF